jgi:hypothetical protein
MKATKNRKRIEFDDAHHDFDFRQRGSQREMKKLLA